jgi:glycolate oxidase FAD binding subunit
VTRLDDALACVASSLGESAVVRHEPLDLEGVRPATTLRPGSVQDLARMLRIASGAGLTLLLRGGGSRLDLGNLPRRADAILDLGGLAAIRELDAEEGVLHAEAGAPLCLLREAVAEAGWELPLDPPGGAATLGGTLASAALGPCFGHPRDAVLGLEVVLASGARTRCGGRVVKNVTGYDLGRLHVGALGTLGVISAAWLRLRPRPEARRVLTASLVAGADALEPAVIAARRPSARAAAWLREAGAKAPELTVELAGEAAAVEADVAWLREELAAGESDDTALERVRALQGAAAPDRLRLRVSALPSRFGDVTKILADAVASLLLYPARGLLWARCEDARGVAAAWAAAQAAARAGRGHALLESAPVSAKRGHDVFAAEPSLLPLMQALKQRYDPGGVLNPGRFAGHL